MGLFLFSKVGLVDVQLCPSSLHVLNSPLTGCNVLLKRSLKDDEGDDEGERFNVDDSGDDLQNIDDEIWDDGEKTGEFEIATVHMFF